MSQILKRFIAPSTFMSFAAAVEISTHASLEASCGLDALAMTIQEQPAQGELTDQNYNAIIS